MLPLSEDFVVDVVSGNTRDNTYDKRKYNAHTITSLTATPFADRKAVANVIIP